MASPVYATALGHDKKAALAVEHLYGLGNHFCERRLGAVGVDRRIESAVRELGEHLAVAGLEREELVLCLDDLVALGADVLVGIAELLVLLVLQRVLRIDVETAAREEVKAGVGEVKGDAVGVAAVVAVGVEAGRRRVRDRHSRHNADFDTRLLRRRGGREQRLPLWIDAGVVVLSLRAAGDRRCRRRGVGHERVSRAGARHRAERHRVHRKGTGAALARELLGRHALGNGHPVADE